MSQMWLRERERSIREGGFMRARLPVPQGISRTGGSEPGQEGY